MKKEVKLLAFHLPQFHAIPENDTWWGKGFTEWTNVKRGRKLFFNHYQPRVPLNQNYYDLSNPQILLEQCELAQNYGIYGFCFYHYYFTGKKLLEKPLENYLAGEHSFPYCFAWANQSFERTWYGKDGNREMLLEQKYGEEREWREHFLYLLPFFKDPAYIKVNNCPMFLIYLSQDFRLCSQMIKQWNEWAMKEGFNGVHVVAMDTGFVVRRFWSKLSATADFEPMRSLRDLPDRINVTRLKRRKKFEQVGITGNKLQNARLVDNLCTYDMFCKNITNRTYDYNIEKNYLGAFTGWDNTARKDESGFVIRNSTPRKFQKLLEKQIERSRELDNEFLFINAWNEWSEGAYLEPDEKNGYAYLEAVKRALANTNK